MTAKHEQGDRVNSKRNWNSIEKGGEISYNLRKKSKSDHPSRVMSDSLIDRVGIKLCFLVLLRVENIFNLL